MYYFAIAVEIVDSKPVSDFLDIATKTEVTCKNKYLGFYIFESERCPPRDRWAAAGYRISFMTSLSMHSLYEGIDDYGLAESIQAKAEQRRLVQFAKEGV